MKPIIWTRRELQRLVDSIVCDPEYGISLLETAFYRLQEGSIKFDYWGSGVLDRWDEKDRKDRIMKLTEGNCWIESDWIVTIPLILSIILIFVALIS